MSVCTNGLAQGNIRCLEMWRALSEAGYVFACPSVCLSRISSSKTVRLELHVRLLRNLLSMNEEGGRRTEELSSLAAALF